MAPLLLPYFHDLAPFWLVFQASISRSICRASLDSGRMRLELLLRFVGRMSCRMEMAWS